MSQVIEKTNKSNLLNDFAPQSLKLSLLFFVSGLIFILFCHNALAASSNSVSVAKIETKTEKSYKIKWRAEVTGLSASEEKEHLQTTRFTLSTGLSFVPSEWINLQVGVSFRAHSAYSQSRFGEFTPGEGMSLNEAYVQLTPLSFLSIDLGAINQRHLNAPLLVEERAFPGILEKLQFGPDEFRFEAKAQQVVPTSKTIATRTIDTEKTPSFTTETVQLSSKPWAWINGTAFASHFRFADLPSVVAFDSSTLGNSVIETGPGSNRFRYNFEGLLYGGRIEISPYKTWQVGISNYIVENQQAPQKLRHAQYSQLDTKLRINSGLSLKSSYALFFNESDSSPAFYNSSDFGHNNRQGFDARLSAEFKNLGFELDARYTQSNLINPSVFQSQQQVLSISLRTLYEIL